VLNTNIVTQDEFKTISNMLDYPELHPVLRNVWENTYITGQGSTPYTQTNIILGGYSAKNSTPGSISIQTTPYTPNVTNGHWCSYNGFVLNGLQPLNKTKNNKYDERYIRNEVQKKQPPKDLDTICKNAADFIDNYCHVPENQKKLKKQLDQYYIDKKKSLIEKQKTGKITIENVVYDIRISNLEEETSDSDIEEENFEKIEIDELANKFTTELEFVEAPYYFKPSMHHKYTLQEVVKQEIKYKLKPNRLWFQQQRELRNISESKYLSVDDKIRLFKEKGITAQKKKFITLPDFKMISLASKEAKVEYEHYLSGKIKLENLNKLKVIDNYYLDMDPKIRRKIYHTPSAPFKSSFPTVATGYLNLIQNFVYGTRSTTNHMQIPFSYTQLISTAMLDIINPENVKLRELVSLQSNTIPGAQSDLTKMLAYGSWSKVQEAKLVPPIMPMVKGLSTLIGAENHGMMVQGINSLDGLDNSLGYIPTFTGTVPIDGYYASIPNTISTACGVMAQWITMQQYLALSISPSFANPTLTDLNNIVGASGVGAHIFVPILKSLVNDGWDALCYAFSFLGYHGTIALTTAVAEEGWVSNTMFSSYDLPVGSYNNSVPTPCVWITFVVFDSQGTGSLPSSQLVNPILFNQFSVMTTIGAAANIQDLFVEGIYDTGHNIATHVSNLSRRLTILSMIRWLSGSQFGRAYFIAANKNTKPVPVWSVDGLGVFNYNNSAIGIADTVIPLMRHYNLENQSTVTNYPNGNVVNSTTMTLPYSADDSVLYALGSNAVYKATYLRVQALATTGYTIALGTLSCKFFKQNATNTIIDYCQITIPETINTLSIYANDLYDLNIFGFQLFIPSLNTIGLTLGDFNALADGAQTLYLQRFSLWPLMISKKERDLYSSEVGTETKVFLTNLNNRVTSFSNSNRYPNAQLADNVDIVLNGNKEIGVANSGKCLNNFSTFAINQYNLYTVPQPTFLEIYGSTFQICYPSIYSIPMHKNLSELIVGEATQIFKIDDSTKNVKRVTLPTFGSDSKK